MSYATKRRTYPLSANYSLSGGCTRSGAYGLGACDPGLASQLAKSGVKAGLTTAAAVDPEPISKGILAVAALFSNLFFPTTSKCAKQSPDPETFLRCWGHPIPNDFIPEWDTNKCGWFQWVKCPGAVGGHYPANGCGPCENPAGGPGFTGGKWTCWQGTNIAPGIPAYGDATQGIDPQTGAPVASVSQDVSNFLGTTGIDPAQIALLAGGGLLGLALLRRARR